MPSNNLSNQYISQSFSAIVQVSRFNRTQLVDGTGSLVEQLTVPTMSGKFIGDGSGLTGVTGEWDGTHYGDAEITGSLIVTGSLRFGSTDCGFF